MLNLAVNNGILKINLGEGERTMNGSTNLSAVNLKHSLWETLNKVKAKKLLPGHADAIASQAREILRTVKMQLLVSGQTNRPVPYDVIEFSESKNAKRK